MQRWWFQLKRSQQTVHSWASRMFLNVCIERTVLSAVMWWGSSIRDSRKVYKLWKKTTSCWGLFWSSWSWLCNQGCCTKCWTYCTTVHVLWDQNIRGPPTYTSTIVKCEWSIRKNSGWLSGPKNRTHSSTAEDVCVCQQECIQFQGPAGGGWLSPHREAGQNKRNDRCEPALERFAFS